ncbi:transcriptional activator of glycolytic enzymes-domain-containing protein, partial [Hyaloscypha sp. PMI_1271]
RDVRTVRDLWREWKVGIAGPPVEQLEQLYGARWRPENKQRAWFCRRKIIIDEIVARIGARASEEAAITALERQRQGKSINKLCDLL